MALGSVIVILGLLAAVSAFSGCVTLMCLTNEVDSLVRVRACDDCLQRDPNFQFCSRFPTGDYCSEHVPTTCNVPTTSALPHSMNFSETCFVAKKAFLPMTVVANDTNAVTFSIPRFFDDEDFNQFQYRHLTLFLRFPPAANKSCQVVIAMPTVDSTDAAGDPFYYDDQTDMSLSVNPKLIPVSEDGKVAVYYAVMADRVVPFQEHTLNFTSTLYSFRTDVVVK